MVMKVVGLVLAVLFVCGRFPVESAPAANTDAVAAINNLAPAQPANDLVVAVAASTTKAQDQQQTQSSVAVVAPAVTVSQGAPFTCPVVSNTNIKLSTLAHLSSTGSVAAGSTCDPDHYGMLSTNVGLVADKSYPIALFTFNSQVKPRFSSSFLVNFQVNSISSAQPVLFAGFTQSSSVSTPNFYTKILLSPAASGKFTLTALADSAAGPGAVTIFTRTLDLNKSYSVQISVKPTTTKHIAMVSVSANGTPQASSSGDFVTQPTTNFTAFFGLSSTGTFGDSESVRVTIEKVSCSGSISC